MFSSDYNRLLVDRKRLFEINCDIQECERPFWR